MTFDTLGLSEKLLKAIHESGYTEPTPIQAAAIPEALKGGDVLGIAQTGTGKTASFTLPMIERLSKGRARARMPRSLVLAPTRELAAQVSENFEKYGKYHKLTMALLIGGVSFADQEAKLMRGVDVLIATPGRLLDHFERGRLLMTGIEVMVVDEADRMLDMGFIPDIERIFKMTPITRQTLFFSATMAPEIQRITDTFLHKPARIEVSRPAQTADTITQKIVRIHSKDERVKRMALRKLLDGDDVKNGIIFCNRKSTVDIVAKSLQTHGFSARPIHGDLTQSFRMETLAKFRDDEVRFLVASDVAARGLDIPDVSHVFNYDVPIHADDYVHRIGRTGRAGRKGTALMLVLDKDKKAHSAILETIGRDSIEEIDFTQELQEAEDEAKKRGPAKHRSNGRKPDGRGSDKRGSERSSRGAGRGSERVSERHSGRGRQNEASEAGQQNDEKRNDESRGERSRTDRKQSSPNRRKAGEENNNEKNASSSSGRDRGGRGKKREPVDDKPVVGLGDHVPDFLRR